jgi:hypothetical protein
MTNPEKLFCCLNITACFVIRALRFRSDILPVDERDQDPGSGVRLGKNAW